MSQVNQHYWNENHSLTSIVFPFSPSTKSSGEGQKTHLRKKKKSALALSIKTTGMIKL